jgi:hypothetical protein
VRQTGLISVFLIVSCIGRVSFGQAVDVDTQDGIPLRPTSTEIAKEVCLQKTSGTCLNDLVQKLAKMSKTERCETQATKALLLRQEIVETVETASLQVEGFLAEIDDETSKIHAVYDRLADTRDNAVGRSTFWTAIGTAGGAVGSALALGAETAVTVGNWLVASSGGVGSYFSFASLSQAKGPKGCFPDLHPNPKNSQNREKGNDCPNRISEENDRANRCGLSGCSPRMLYQVFNPGQPVGFHSEYDATVSNYLAGPSPADPQKSRKDELIERWGAVADTSFLISGNPTPQKISIEKLAERVNKLADLRVVVARVNRDLGRFMEDVTAGLRCY